MSNSPVTLVMLIAFISSSFSAPFSEIIEERKKRNTCDIYCTDDDPTNDACEPSTKADLTMEYDYPSSWVNPNNNAKYAKCYNPFSTDGKTSKISCPKNPIPVDCESCGWTWSSGDSLPGIGNNGETAPYSEQSTCCDNYYDSDGYRFFYDYKWNVEKARKSAYPETVECSLWNWCDTGYDCARTWSWGWNFGKGTCKISSEAKFLDDECQSTDQCKKLTSPHVNMICSPTIHKCVLAEDETRLRQSEAQGAKIQCSCSIFDHWDFRSTFTGLITCVNYEQCNGNECTLTTRDGNKYCSNYAGKGQTCSNCRKNVNACT